MNTKILAVFTAVFLLVGCDSGVKSGRGFSLPDGDVDRGREAFVALQCNACHYIGDVEQLPAADEEDRISVMLGGKVGSIRTYGELVTSVINPSHRLIRRYPKDQVATEEGESLMRVYNDVMTVNQLIDLVAFLQSNYTLQPYERTTYRLYHP